MHQALYSNVMATATMHKQIIGILYTMITILVHLLFLLSVWFFLQHVCKLLPRRKNCYVPSAASLSYLLIIFLQALLCGVPSILGTGMLLMWDQNEILWLNLQHLLETGPTCVLGCITPCLNGLILSSVKMPPTSSRQESFQPVNHYQNSMKL